MKLDKFEIAKTSSKQYSEYGKDVKKLHSETLLRIYPISTINYSQSYST